MPSSSAVWRRRSGGGGGRAWAAAAAAAAPPRHGGVRQARERDSRAGSLPLRAAQQRTQETQLTAKKSRDAGQTTNPGDPRGRRGSRSHLAVVDGCRLETTKAERRTLQRLWQLICPPQRLLARLNRIRANSSAELDDMDERSFVMCFPASQTLPQTVPSRTKGSSRGFSLPRLDYSQRWLQFHRACCAPGCPGLRSARLDSGAFATSAGLISENVTCAYSSTIICASSDGFRGRWFCQPFQRGCLMPLSRIRSTFLMPFFSGADFNSLERTDGAHHSEQRKIGEKRERAGRSTHACG